ncbi:MAG: isoleucine--tRNA ligase, partial [Actinobacteria bacterium]
ELYLEGSDQHRGWFQSSLLTSVGAYGIAPFERVLTHGFIVDGDGRKMSKSLGNVVSPLDVIAKSGADIVRLWVANADYGQDVNISDEILDRTGEAYRRIRNTFRFLLSNLNDFDPSDAVAWSDMPELDRYALVRLADVLERATANYDEWRFYLVMRTLSDYLGDFSAVYLDVIKDRLYADAPTSVARRSAQTVLAQVLGTLVRAFAPVLSFTCEEVWGFMPEAMRDADSVHLSDWPSVSVPDQEAQALREAYGAVLAVREVVTKALEDARNAKLVGKSQEARIEVVAPAEVTEVLAGRGAAALAELFIVSDVAWSTGAVVSAKVLQAEGEKCPRCWNHRELGVDPAHADVCARCASVLAETAR